MWQFTKNLFRTSVLKSTTDTGYRAMAADKMREAEASEWVKALSSDLDGKCGDKYSVECAVTATDGF